MIVSGFHLLCGFGENVDLLHFSSGYFVVDRITECSTSRQITKTRHSITRFDIKTLLSDRGEMRGPLRYNL